VNIRVCVTATNVGRDTQDAGLRSEEMERAVPAAVASRAN